MTSRESAVAQVASEARRYTLLVRDEGDGMLWGEVAELPGCFASGADRAELREAAVEAVRLYVGADVAVELDER